MAKNVKIPQKLREKDFEGYSIEDYLLNLVNGYYSGYPSCCIEYFCKLKQKGLFPAVYNHWKYPKEVNSSKAQYVQCPKCLKAKKYLKETEIRKGSINYRVLDRIVDMTFEIFEKHTKQLIIEIIKERNKRKNENKKRKK